MSIILVDARSDSLTVTWPAITGADYYMLEFRTDGDDWELLADDLQQPLARKHNLHPDQPYYFRAAPLFEGTQQIGQWMIHREPYMTLDTEEEEYCMAPPVVRVDPTHGGVLIVAWEEVEEAYFFELQMRENRGGSAWQTVGDGEIHGMEVKKKNLTSQYGYCFRVRPVTESEEPWSAPSTGVVAVALNDNVPRRSNNMPAQPRGRPPPRVKPRTKKQPKPRLAAKDPNAMDPPFIKNAGIQNAALVCWNPVPGATGYELQMRENSGSDSPWVTVAPNLSGCEVRKKNLTSSFGYLFRVRPNGLGPKPFSLASNIAIAT